MQGVERRVVKTFTMKSILITALFVCSAIEAVVTKPHQHQDADIIKSPKNKTEILSNSSCRYLKIKGYLNKIRALQKLCLETFYCNDVLSHESCTILKTKGECKKASSLSLMYCKFTCNKCHYCVKRPLGMESGAIPDSSINASSIYSSSYPPSSARLNNKDKGYGWAAKTNVVGQWIQVHLENVTKVTGVATQGRNLNGEWVKSYSLQYSDDGTAFTNYQGGKIFQGNTDYNTVVKHELEPPIVARYIRLLPKTWNNHMTMRMELYGCK